MKFGVPAGNNPNDSRGRHEPTGRLCHLDRRRGRRRYARQQHQAPDATPTIAIPVIVAGRRLPSVCSLADDEIGSGRIRDCSANGADARDKARQRNRISDHQRSHAPQQRPLGETLMQSRAQCGTTP